MVSAGPEPRSRIDGAARAHGGVKRARDEARHGGVYERRGLSKARRQRESAPALQTSRRSAAQRRRENSGATMVGETQAMILNLSFIRRSALLVASVSFILG